MNPLDRVKKGGKQPPARVFLLFIGALISLQGLVLLFSQVSLPGYGTPWSALTAIAGAIVGWLPLILRGVVDNYSFVLGAVAVLGLINIYWVSCRTGVYAPGIVDVLVGLMAGLLFVVFHCYPDEILPYNSSFFYRVSLFSVWSLLTVSLTAIVVFCDDLGTSIVSIDNFCLAAIASAICTGVFSFQCMNGILHFLANLSGMAVWFLFSDQLQSRLAGGAVDEGEGPRERACEGRSY